MRPERLLDRACRGRLGPSSVVPMSSAFTDDQVDAAIDLVTVCRAIDRAQTFLP